MNPIESLLIDGEKAKLDAFAVPEMSLSSSRTAMKAHSFVMEIRPAAMSEFLTPVYEEWVKESKEDDEAMGSPQDELAEAGYPSLDHLTNTPEILKIILGSYLLHDFIGKLTCRDSKSARYWLDKVTDCRTNNNAIYLYGICYSHPL